MSYVNQVPNLPFRYDAPMSQLVQYRIDSPPYVPQVQNCPPQLQYLLPAICSTIANELASKCNAHPGRMFLFNQISFNNYANNDFTTLVGFVVDSLVLQLNKGVIRSAEEGLMSVINDMLSIFTSLLFQNFPSLQSVTPPEIVFEASKNVNAFVSLSNEIANMRMRAQGQPMMGQPMMNQNVGFQQPMMVNPSFGMNMPMNSSMSPGMSSVSQPMMNQGGFVNNQQNYNRSINPTSIFTSGNQQNNQVQIPISNQSSGKYDYLKPKTPPQTPQAVVSQTVFRVSTPANMPVSEAVAEVKSGLKLSDWMPSLSQSYPPTINPFTSKLAITQTVKNGVGNKILKIVKLEDSEMDRSKHVISSMSQVYTARIPEPHGTRDQSLEENVKKIFQIDKEMIDESKKDENSEEPETLELKNYIRTEWVYDNFIEPSIFSGRFQQKEHSIKDTDCSIYRVYRIIANPIICEQDHSAFINELAACKTFKEIAIILRETINDNLTSKSLIDLCYGIDKILTKEINNILRNKMSIPNTAIDSFIDDASEIGDYLGKHLGDMYKRVFLDFQKSYIPQIISCPKPDEIDGIIQCCIVEESENPLVKVNFINHSYSITYLTVESQELGIKPFDECASAVLEYEHPLMFKIITGIFSQDREIDRECLHNLIVTSDDVIYEVQKGLIGSDIFTTYCWKK